MLYRLHLIMGMMTIQDSFVDFSFIFLAPRHQASKPSLVPGRLKKELSSSFLDLHKIDSFLHKIRDFKNLYSNIHKIVLGAISRLWLGLKIRSVNKGCKKVAKKPFWPNFAVWHLLWHSKASQSRLWKGYWKPIIQLMELIKKHIINQWRSEHGYIFRIKMFKKIKPLLLPESTRQTTAKGPPSLKGIPWYSGGQDMRGLWGGSAMN